MGYDVFISVVLDRPSFLIAFNILTSDSGYDANLKLWKIRFSGIRTDQAALRYLKRQYRNRWSHPARRVQRRAEDRFGRSGQRPK